MGELCVTHKVEIANESGAPMLSRSISNDPALASLIRDGWTVVTTVVLNTNEGSMLNLILAPPAPAVPDSTPAWWRPVVTGLLVVIAGASVVCAVMLAVV